MSVFIYTNPCRSRHFQKATSTFHPEYLHYYPFLLVCLYCPSLIKLKLLQRSYSNGKTGLCSETRKCLGRSRYPRFSIKNVFISFFSWVIEFHGYSAFLTEFFNIISIIKLVTNRRESRFYWRIHPKSTRFPWFIHSVQSFISSAFSTLFFLLYCWIRPKQDNHDRHVLGSTSCGWIIALVFSLRSFSLMNIARKRACTRLFRKTS